MGAQRRETSRGNAGIGSSLQPSEPKHPSHNGRATHYCSSMVDLRINRARLGESLSPPIASAKMTVSRERFELALERLKDSDWEKFENLASAFLAADFSKLRTMASSSGDGGRDSELFSPDGEPTVAFQYSVQESWPNKIKKTVKRLKENFPKVNFLYYVSNQEIGARADKLKRELAKDGIFVDILDRTWFLDRFNLDQQRSEAASSISRSIVDPLLEQKGILSRKNDALSRNEAGTALIFLELQQQDEVAGKNLTRSSFEALVRAALHGSNKDNRIKREAIYERVQTFLPQHSPDQLKHFIDAALTRLKRHALNEWNGGAEFNINYQESERIKDSSAKLILKRSAFEHDIMELIKLSPDVAISDMSEFIQSVHRIVETYFLRRGEEFAGAVAGARSIPMNDTDLRQIVSQHTSKAVSGRPAAAYTQYIVTSILNNPSASTLEYLRLISDSYTLMSFLSETPDVQSVTKKLFSHGEIWLDTSVLLPLFAEKILTEKDRSFSSAIIQAKKSGADLYVTAGVIEEIERHINRSLQCARAPHWTGGTPYLYARYIIGGGKRGSFNSWVEQFRGEYNPEQDIADYLHDFGIKMENPSEALNIPLDVRDAVTNYWQEIHDRRRGSEGFNMVSDRLAKHDIENCLTVLSSRMDELGRAPLGHKSWWLTLDSAAFRMLPAMEDEIARKIKHSPILSIDFLIKYLAFGPSRDKLPDAEKNITRIFAPAIMETLPSELIDVAEKVRSDCAGLSENIIQRRIRDALDRAKSKIGAIHQGGLENMDKAILSIY